MFLDGLVAGGAFLLIASVLVYAELLSSPPEGGAGTRVLALLFPVAKTFDPMTLPDEVARMLHWPDSS